PTATWALALAVIMNGTARSIANTTNLKLFISFLLCCLALLLSDRGSEAHLRFQHLPGLCSPSRLPLIRTTVGRFSCGICGRFGRRLDPICPLFPHRCQHQQKWPLQVG